MEPNETETLKAGREEVGRRIGLGDTRTYQRLVSLTASRLQWTRDGEFAVGSIDIYSLVSAYTKVTLPHLIPTYCTPILGALAA